MVHSHGIYGRQWFVLYSFFGMMIILADYKTVTSDDQLL